MKKFTFVASSSLLGLGMGLGAMAAEAPVEDASTSFVQDHPVSAVSTVVHEAPVAELAESTGEDVADKSDQSQVNQQVVPQSTLAANTDSSSGQNAENVQPQSQENAPTTDQQPGAHSATDASQLPMTQRVTRLEQQLTNIVNMNLPQQITLLQQQIAQMRGQLEVQGHDLQLLNKQLRSFYQDLNNRINQSNNLNSSNNSSSVNSNPKPNTNVLSGSNSVQLQDANAYQLAFSQLTKRQYSKAQQLFATYMSDYPNGQYVADAHYWLGEIYLAEKNYQKAKTEFDTVISQYPKSAKISDAKLKIAIIHAHLGKIDQAKTELQKIKRNHPNTTAAQLANIRLQQIEQNADLTNKAD